MYTYHDSIVRINYERGRSDASACLSVKFAIKSMTTYHGVNIIVPVAMHAISLYWLTVPNKTWVGRISMASKQTNNTVRTRVNHPFHCSFLNGSVRVPSRMRTMPHTVNPVMKPILSLAMAPIEGRAGDSDASSVRLTSGPAFSRLTTAGGLNPGGRRVQVGAA
jgi:hypothetical protein